MGRTDALWTSRGTPKASTKDVPSVGLIWNSSNEGCHCLVPTRRQRCSDRATPMPTDGQNVEAGGWTRDTDGRASKVQESRDIGVRSQDTTVIPRPAFAPSKCMCAERPIRHENSHQPEKMATRSTSCAGMKNASKERPRSRTCDRARRLGVQRGSVVRLTALVTRERGRVSTYRAA